MRVFRVLLVGLVALLVSAASYGQAPTLTPIPDTRAQALFDDAIRWSRATGLETGGCFSILRVWGTATLVVHDATEAVYYRRPLKVAIRCEHYQGVWHTHWLPESDSTVGCNVSRAADLYLIGPRHPFGLTVCGVGRDSVIPFTYDPTHQPPPSPPEPGDTLYRCKDEPVASLRRGKYTCLRPS
jgi:hypothetical protein